MHGVEEECLVVSRQVGSVRKALETSPMHYQYTTYMRGVDVADQLRGEYSSQVRTHKWWHRLFFFSFGHYRGKHVETTLQAVFNFRNPTFESQIFLIALGQSFGLKPPPVLQVHFSVQSACQTSPYAHVEPIPQSLLRMPHTVPNLLSLLPWASYAHWRMLGGGAPTHFRLKVMLVNMFFFFYICTLQYAKGS
jgi:hypothetical protein